MTDNIIKLTPTLQDESYKGHTIHLRINPITKLFEASFVHKPVVDYKYRGYTKESALNKAKIRIDRLVR